MGVILEIIQVAGFSNSGKTTLIENIVKSLKELNKSVSVIKHHGHENRLVALDAGKDSAKFRDAGATGTTVVAGNTIQMHFDQEKSWSVSDALRFQQFLNIDVVIIEGFKQEPFPKVVIVRREEDVQLLQQLKNIQVIIVWNNIKLQGNFGVPIFVIDEFDEFFEWLMNNWLEINRNKKEVEE
ncbi:molybdopterin-guanine dinucleotide biosynthesis protein B [Alkalihalophilus pseudofirmus]|uniref:molybdopterin-guanine dinucleotide biosynthesis protein B n=1 Tax=Alkalihalobacterium alkalinitrilicum TaxID=427920 RepID=UPI00094C47C2|nr:molybdopterin-guanine dinucleotide biosynthesis protein B [Alkalihalobacterium alkalinitrilicum]OLO26852.1 molybdopterin-guanine dinucleotide biosynthesis protein B [Alkalihalophilus pseudofirmus]